MGGFQDYDLSDNPILESEQKGVIELLWDIFGGTINEQGYKVLDPHIGAIYGDSITPERQIQIYKRLAAKGFASTNIILGVGSYTYQYTTRDWASMAAKGSWFEVLNQCEKPCGPQCKEEGKCGNAHYQSYNIYKDPITDDGNKRSLKGLLSVINSEGKYYVKEECTPEEEADTKYNELQVIYENGNFYNTTTLEKVRNRLKLI